MFLRRDECHSTINEDNKIIFNYSSMQKTNVLKLKMENTVRSYNVGKI